MKRSRIAIWLAALLAAPLVQAQTAPPSTYVKLGGGQARTDADFWGKDSDTAALIAAGAQVSSNMDVELGYIHLGKAKYAFAGNSMTARSESVYLAAVGRSSLRDGFSLYGKLGAAYNWTNWRGVRDAAAFDTDDRRFGPMVGIGATWQFMPNWAADLEYAYFSRTRKVAGEATDVDLWTIGLKYLW